MIKMVDCNLLDADAEIICQNCNCFNTMGSGVALSIRTEYPEAYEADCQTKKGDKNKLGTVSLAVVKDPSSHKNQKIKAICNIYGQYSMGAGERHVNYEAIYSGLEELKIRLKPAIKTIGLPYKMGADRAGGNWDIIYKMIEVVFENSGFDVLICRYTPPTNV